MYDKNVYVKNKLASTKCSTNIRQCLYSEYIRIRDKLNKFNLILTLYIIKLASLTFLEENNLKKKTLKFIPFELE